MDDELRSAAARMLTSAPCSVELPAGTGKTHLLAAAVALAAGEGKRLLVLTHTNAGVDAIRRRLRDFGVVHSSVRVDTITSWAFTLVGAYSVIAEMSVADAPPDWTQSDDYLLAATKVARSNSIADVHRVSFDYLFVDEYQDCTVVQHEFILVLAAAIPQSVILGDRLQAIFSFAGALVDWDSDVLPRFPPTHVDVEPHRWTNHNVDLGRWLLDIRTMLVPGAFFDFAAHQVPGLNFVPSTDVAVLVKTAHSFRNFDETVVLLDKWPKDVAGHASRLGGSYTVMEDIGGNFMRAQLRDLPAEGNPLLAHWFALFAKACIVGLSGIDATVQRRLEQNRSVSHYVRPGLEPFLTALDKLRINPTYAGLAEASGTVRGIAGVRVYRWEAWNDTREAIARTAESGEPPLVSLGQVRERLRRTGRRNENRIASRTLLVKGLEYDHVIIADLSMMKDPRNLYVALSRARKSVSVLGTSSQIQLANDG